MKKIRSRIMEIFDKEILKEMYELQSKRLTWGMVRGQRTKVEYTAKMKVQDMTDILTKYLSKKEYSFSFPGAGTNRMTILIDGYIYKIALDQDGYIDNLNEFILSKEAQPYVTKTYETNGLIAVAEYVTLISYEEFVDKKEKILEILDDISREYLIGDMGWTQKNYANWGYRKNSDDLVILDFGHMHRLSGEKLLCKECCSILQYNSTYTKLKCLDCGKEEEFMTIKLRLSKKEERDNIDKHLERAYQLTEPVKMVEESEIIPEEEYEYEDEELVSTRFPRFAPKKKRRFEYVPKEEEPIIVDEIPMEVYDEVLDEYMKVVKGKVKIKDKEKKVDKPVVKNVTDKIRLEIEELNDDVLAERYVFDLFVMDKIDEDQYNYYMDCIENGFDDDNEESIFTEEEITPLIEPDPESYEVMDIQNNDEVCELDDKTIIFNDSEEDNEEPFTDFESLVDFINDESEEVTTQYEDLTFDDEDEVKYYEPLSAEDIAAAKQAMGMTSREVNEEEISLNVIEAEEVPAENNDGEEEEEVVGIKLVNNTNTTSSVIEQEDKEEEVGIKIKPSNSQTVVDVTNTNEESTSGIKVIKPKQMLDQEQIMLKMREIQNQRVLDMETEKDYSHYEDEFAHLYDDEDVLGYKKRR